MKKIGLKVIVCFNALLWIIISTVNYVGIMQQLNEDIMRIFLWSIFTVMMYSLIIYSISLVITRIGVLYRYRDCKDKYVDSTALTKQLLYLCAAIFYVYGVCYFNSDFLGLIPMVLFFGKKLINVGRFYAYEDGRLFLFEENDKEYLVLEINLESHKLIIQERYLRDPYTREATYPSSGEENKFINGYLEREHSEKEVA